jgi:DNA-binding protein WhiA
MSFSSECKSELARVEEGKKCCTLAWIAGFVRMCGRVMLAGGGRLQLRVVTEDPAVARLFVKQVKSYFAVGAELSIQRNQSGISRKTYSYSMVIDAESGAEQILRETGILTVREGCNVLSQGIFEPLIKKKCCRRAYLRGAFLGAGSVSDPEKSYHLDVSCNSGELAQDLRRLVNGFGLRAKVAPRRKMQVVYLKEAEQISDLLTILGAHNTVLRFENVRVTKEVRNAANRKVNCDAANLDKTVNTAARQIEEIRLIEERMGLRALPDSLRALAELRLSHPEASLTELGGLLDPPLKKSGVNHRFQKLSEIAGKYTK